MFDRVRYFLGAVSVIVLPLGVLYWCVIHGWFRWWRKLGPARTYLIVIPVLAALGTALYRVRDFLLGADLGTNPALIGIAALLWIPMIWLETRYWKHLNVATLAGVRELSVANPGKLLREGIYGIVRHPRYLSAGIGFVAQVLIINHAGLYILFLLVLPAGYVLLELEERELVDRFGASYRQYQREVPRLIPRLWQGDDKLP